jgi:hypothetical protein
MKRSLKIILGISVVIIAGFIVDAFLHHAAAQEKKEEKTIIMDRIRIRGKIERPEAVYIIDVTNPNFKPIRIERSFQDEILEPVDKDEFEDEIKHNEKLNK